jgi:acyl-CoA synthetase (AMP-forming)/AMP-acid ligase II
MQIFPGIVFDQWYGSTEGTGGWFTQLTPADHVRALAGEEHLLESCGRAMHHAAIKVVDEAGRPVAPGEVGEVCVRGAFTMAGYFNDAERSAETLKDGWLRTGDMGRIDAEGFLYLVDRKQFMIISGGYNVYPVEVENALAAHDAVAEVCVFGIPDERWGEAVHALVVLRSGHEALPEQLRAWCAQRLASFKVPKIIELRASLLRGPTGKILKRAHKEEYWKKAPL